MRRAFLLACIGCAAAVWVSAISASTPGTDVKLTHDASDPGYVSEYTLGEGVPYTDQTLAECSVSRGRQNEPAVAIDPRDPQVVLGSPNDYCGAYNPGAAPGAIGPIWPGHYRPGFHGNRGGVGIYFARSTDHGATFTRQKVSQTISDVQFPDIAVTGNDNVYLFFRSFASGRGPEGDAIYYVKSVDCGATFSAPVLL